MKFTHWVLLFGLALYVTLTLLSMRDEALVNDELEHIAASHEYIHKASAGYNAFHPPLVKIIVGIALEAFDIQPLKKSPTQFLSKEYGRRLLFQSGNDPRFYILVARLTVFLINFICICLLLFSIYRCFSSSIAGFVSICIATSPNFIAHSRYVTFDVSVAFLIGASFCFLLLYIQNNNKSDLFLGLLCSVGSCLIKYSGLITIPFLLYTCFFRNFSKDKFLSQIKANANIALPVICCGLCLLWTFYFFSLRGLRAEQIYFYAVRLKFEGMPTAWYVVEHLLKYNCLLPVAWWVTGLSLSLHHIFGGAYNVGYLLGETYEGGRFLFYPIVWIGKQTPIFLCVVIGGFIFLFQQHQKIIDRKFKVFLSLALGYALLLFLSNADQGVRYMFPFDIALYILVSCVLLKVLSERRYYQAVVALLVGGGTSLFLSYPTFLSYYNFLYGGFRGGSYVALDSNFDWGQDLLRIPEAMKKYQIPHVYLDYMGQSKPVTFLPSSMLTTWNGVRNPPPKGSFYAVSIYKVRVLQARKYSPKFTQMGYQWLIGKEPIAVAGTSIYIYKID